MELFTLYGDSRSGNCLKIRWCADYLGIPYNWIETDIIAGKTRTRDFLAMNNYGQVPTAIFKNGDRKTTIAQSNAILIYLAEQAEDQTLYPQESTRKAVQHEWLFWEQNSHEPYIAGRRFRKTLLGHNDKQIDREWLPRGHTALARMELALGKTDYIAGDHMTVADIALIAYTRVAPEGGFPLTDYPCILKWIDRMQHNLKIST